MSINIAILGLGVVGAEFVNIFNNKKSQLEENFNSNYTITKAYVRDINKKRKCDTSKIKVTNEIDSIINDKEIDIVVECMGGSGTEETKEIVLKLLKNNKNIVMSSKKVLALYGKEIINLSYEKNCFLKFDATVGGGIPIAKVLQTSFKGDEIKKVIGILNATSNYICTKMEKDFLEYDESLKEAQRLGYAENDPTEDVEGYDALYKSVILTLFAMNSWVDPKKLITTGLSEIKKTDIEYALELGYTIKPLAVFERLKNKIIYRIGPCLVPKEHIVANTYDNNNVIVLEGQNSGQFAFYGQGAGSKPTAGTMFDDVVEIIQRISFSKFNNRLDKHIEHKKETNVELYRNHMYMRIVVENKIGKLNEITHILAQNKLNIDKIIQKKFEGDKMGIVFMTSSVAHETMQKIRKEFNNIGVRIVTLLPYI